MSIASGLRVLVGTAEGLHECGGRERSVFEGHELTALSGDGDLYASSASTTFSLNP